MPPHGRRASSTVPPPYPALAGTVACGQSPIPSGNAPIPSCTLPPMDSREAEPPSGGHRRPPDGSESLRKILTMPPHGRRASSTVPSTWGHGRERAKPYSVGQRPYSVVHPAAHGLQRGWATLRSYWQPPGGSESLHKIGTMPPQGRTRNGGTGSPPVRGHRQNFTKALRAVGRPPVASGGWLGLSGGHGRRGARRNMGVTRRNRHLPAREDARKGWERWNWLAACAGASLEFFEGSPSRRWAVGGLRRVARPLWRPLAAGYSTE